MTAPHDRDGIDLREAWHRQQTGLLAELETIGATEEAFTVVIRLIARSVNSPQDFANELKQAVDPRESWAFLTTVDQEGRKPTGYALPARVRTPRDIFLLPLVEIHTLLVGWWLGTVWRTRQLSRAASSLADAHQTIAAAACVRALVETAAAAWVDGTKLARAWSAMKQAGEPSTEESSLRLRNALLGVLIEATWGANFDDRAPDLKSTWGRIQRTNVLGAVDKLAKAASGRLQEDYQWLCNTVHPSVGNTLTFSSPPLMHRTKTHALFWLSAWPTEISGGGGAERTVQNAVLGAAATSTATLRVTLDAALRFVDDLALTSGAPALSNQDYWRKVVDVGRDALCPCRSGKKRKQCRHAWGEAGPEMPRSFD